jgi:hypothetical protein
MPSNVNDISQAEALDLFEYKDGILYNKTTRSNRSLKGAVAGGLNSQGYICVRINKMLVRAHRVIWVMHNGGISKGMMIDHIDRDRTNNKIENLRLVDASENMFNRSRVNGCAHQKKVNKFTAEIWSRNKRHYLGLFETEELAKQAYLNAKVKVHAIGGATCQA